MFFGQYAVLLIVLFGHVALWIAVFHRTHSFSVPRRWIKVIELILILACISLMGLIVHRYLRLLNSGSENFDFGADSSWLLPYSFLTLAFAGWTTVHWLYRKWHASHPPQLLTNDSKMFHIGEELDQLPVKGWSARLFACLPMNQMFDLCVNVKTLELPRLPLELDGLTITHFSDLHFTGKITRPFFDRVMDQVEALAGDLIVLTGDIVEELSCYDWLPLTLGRLRAPHGMYFVLGNHDLRMRDIGRLRGELNRLGYVDVASSTHSIKLHNRTIQLAGNEYPWFGRPVEPPLRTSDVGLRILLSHSPDQFRWAVDRDFDLMVAGHTHGGHIRLPLIGPIVCPSRFGVQFAGGVFYNPPTVMHVSCGISGMDPLRFNCPPEVTKLVLRSPRGSQ